MKKLLWCILPLVLLACNSKRNIKSQYPNGMVYEDYYESKQHPGQKEGVYRVYDDKGGLIEEANYKKGLLDGKRILLKMVIRKFVYCGIKTDLMKQIVSSYYPIRILQMPNLFF
jgi:hypothetical protein